MRSLALLAVALPLYVLAYPQGMGMPPPPVPPVPRELPPGFAQILPADVVAQLKSIHENDLMPPHQKHEKIDAIMVNLPDSVADKLPAPPGFERLPQNVRDQLKSIQRDKTLQWQQRGQKIHEYIMSLPQEVRNLLPPPPPPPTFQAIPRQSQLELEAIQQNTSLNNRQRHRLITAVLDRLPSDIRQALPPTPREPMNRFSY